MIRNHLTMYAVLAGLSLSAGTGCPLRKEKITVTADGAVFMELRYEGTAQELERFDALPSAESGWNVVRTVEKEDKDEETHVLTTERRFAPDEELPRDFSAPGDPDADLYLDFPTTLRVEQRADGLYFYFHRVYTPRRWAYVQHWHDFFIDDHIKKISDKPVEELTRNDRTQVVQALIGVEAFQQVEFAKAALAECEPELDQAYWLLARRALLKAYAEDHLLAGESSEEVYEEGTHYSTWFDHIVDRCDPLEDDEQNKCYEEEAERLMAEGCAALVRSLREDAGFNHFRTARFERSYERARRYNGITNGLGAHGFQIDVAMPGEIVAHSALDEDVDEDEGVSVVRFEFDGKAFRDRPYEIMVVSRVENDPDPARRSRVDGDRK